MQTSNELLNFLLKQIDQNNVESIKCIINHAEDFPHSYQNIIKVGLKNIAFELLDTASHEVVLDELGRYFNAIGLGTLTLSINNSKNKDAIKKLYSDIRNSDVLRKTK